MKAKTDHGLKEFSAKTLFFVLKLPSFLVGAAYIKSICI
jgi:hypothetical protein